MTREEAIAFFKDMNECTYGNLEAVEMAIKALEQEPKSEWQKDHEILKAYSDGANGVLDELRDEIAKEKEHACADFERYKVEYLGQDWEDALDSLPQDDFRYGMERCIDIINKYKIESEEQMPPERDCVNCVYSKDGHISFSETCHNCMWKNQFIPKFKPKRIKASDIKSDDEWMKENKWDEIYKAESEDCISKKAVLDKINEICFSREQESVDFRVAQGSNGQRDLIINFIENLPSVQSKPKTEVLDKIRAEIDRQEKWLMCAGYNAYNVDIAFNSIKSVLSESEE